MFVLNFVQVSENQIKNKIFTINLIFLLLAFLIGIDDVHRFINPFKHK